MDIVQDFIKEKGGKVQILLDFNTDYLNFYGANLEYADVYGANLALETPSGGLPPSAGKATIKLSVKLNDDWDLSVDDYFEFKKTLKTIYQEVS